MLPFLAQGASSAIEDAIVLAKCLEEGQTDVASAFARYESLRASRVARVQRAARRMGAIYHLHGAMAIARDQVMKALGGARLLERQDWIYDWRETRTDGRV